MLKNYKNFIKEEKEYDFGHPDVQDEWKLNVPSELPQKGDMLKCTDNKGVEDQLTIGKEYYNLGLKRFRAKVGGLLFGTPLGVGSKRFSGGDLVNKLVGERIVAEPSEGYSLIKKLEDKLDCPIEISPSTQEIVKKHKKSTKGINKIK